LPVYIEPGKARGKRLLARKGGLNAL